MPGLRGLITALGCCLVVVGCLVVVVVLFLLCWLCATCLLNFEARLVGGQIGETVSVVALNFLLLLVVTGV